jgi:hypothetical protein
VERGGAGAVCKGNSSRLNPIFVPAPWVRQAEIIIRELAEDNGASLDAVLGVGKTRLLAAIRRQACREVSANNPRLSLRQLGAIFRRDRSVIHGYLKRAA